ncbi:MAG TPA: hypothetical protein VMN36_19135 [Verrucomicrobiales bacterium]|nr:hypothetical protein [Verrucomicrobiales bacterium]
MSPSSASPSSLLPIRLHYAAQLGLAAGCSEETALVAPGTLLSETLQSLASNRSPLFRQLLFDENDCPRRSLVVAVDGVQLADLADFRLRQSHDILLLTPMAGG